MPLTEEQIARLEALEQAATPGPWEHRKHPGDYGIIRVMGDRQCPVPDHDDCAVLSMIQPDLAIVGLAHAPDTVAADATLIAEMRNALPALIAALRASQAEVRRLREHLQTIRDHYGKVCDGYELCRHEACESSVGAWSEADAALAPAREET